MYDRFDYYREDGELMDMGNNEYAAFWIGALLGALATSFVAGVLFSDVTTPAEYSAAAEVCESNGGLKKIGSYIDTQKVFCMNGASFDQNFEKIEREAR